MFGGFNTTVMLVTCALFIGVVWLLWRDIMKTKQILDQKKKIVEMYEFYKTCISDIKSNVNQCRQDCVNMLNHAFTNKQFTDKTPSNTQKNNTNYTGSVTLNNNKTDPETSLDASFQEFQQNMVQHGEPDHDEEYSDSIED